MSDDKFLKNGNYNKKFGVAGFEPLQVNLLW